MSRGTVAVEPEGGVSVMSAKPSSEPGAFASTEIAARSVRGAGMRIVTAAPSPPASTVHVLPKLERDCRSCVGEYALHRPTFG